VDDVYHVSARIEHAGTPFSEIETLIVLKVFASNSHDYRRVFFGNVTLKVWKKWSGGSFYPQIETSMKP